MQFTVKYLFDCGISVVLIEILHYNALESDKLISADES